jgi:hypothetical protein
VIPIRLAIPASAVLAVLAACSSPARTGAPATQPTSPAPGAVGVPAASGSSAPGSPAAQPPPAGVANDAEAVAEIRATRDGYLSAQEALRAGRRDEALELMNTAYIDHFERTEPYLDQRFSRDYRQDVEAAISRDLRRRLRDGAPDAEVLAQFAPGLAKLAEAEQRLGGG